ncbi:putative methyltransferase, partial [Haemophilus influenzae]
KKRILKLSKNLVIC